MYGIDAEILTSRRRSVAFVPHQDQNAALCWQRQGPSKAATPLPPRNSTALRLIAIIGPVVIGEALARALYDTPLHVLQKLREEGYHDQCVDIIAERMVRELGHARWQMKGPPREDRRTLDGFIHCGLKLSNCSHITSPNPDTAKCARVDATEKICSVLRSHRVVLVQWRRR